MNGLGNGKWLISELNESDHRSERAFCLPQVEAFAAGDERQTATDDEEFLNASGDRFAAYRWYWFRY